MRINQYTGKGSYSRRAFMVLDAIVGLLVVAVVAGLLSAMLTRVSRASGRLAEQREATARLEAAAVLLSSGKDLPPDVQREPIDAHWVRLSTHTAGRRAKSTTVDLIAPLPHNGGRP